MQDINRLENFPISFFAAVMGLAGLTIAWEKIQHTLDIDLNINVWLVGVTAMVFVILIAPPAVGFIAYLQLVGTLDSFARVLYFAGLFLSFCCSPSWVASPSYASSCPGGPTRSRWPPSRLAVC